MRALAWLSFGTLATLTAFCGFRPEPASGTVACGVGGAACCPEDYVCVGRGAVTEGSTASGVGTCWRKQDVPPGVFHDYTLSVPDDPACLVTDWLPPGLSLPVPPDAGAGGGGGSTLATSDGGPTAVGTGGTGPAVGPIQVSCGDAHTCAVVEGKALCWGLNRYGQLGNDSVIDHSLVPVPVVGLDSGVTEIAAGDFHTCAVVNGGLQCWGSNFNDTHTKLPTQVPGLEAGVTGVCAGAGYSCAIVGGEVQCWGHNKDGQLGDGTTTDKLLPVRVPGLGAGVTAVACGVGHTCVVIRGGVRCWGRNYDGETGDATKRSPRLTPMEPNGIPPGVTDVGAGIQFTCALSGGGVYCFGQNGGSQLGNGSFQSELYPVQPRGLTKDVTAIAIGSEACAILDGAAWCWGDKLANENPYSRKRVPIKVVERIGTKKVTGVAMGTRHACLVLGKEIMCWGNNDSGQIGNGLEGGWAYYPDPVLL
jgi:alpha-tubulin suppressor-like RCC1 family protein